MVSRTFAPRAWDCDETSAGECDVGACDLTTTLTLSHAGLPTPELVEGAERRAGGA
jgi:hypothetical protein